MSKILKQLEKEKVLLVELEEAWDEEDVYEAYTIENQRGIISGLEMALKYTNETKENVIDVTNHGNPFDKALMEITEIYRNGDDDLDTVLDSVEIHGLTVNETTALFAHLHWQIEEDMTTITVEHEIKTLRDYITIRGNRKADQ